MRWALQFLIPGEPKPQGRPRAGRWKAKDGRSGISLRDPKASRDWKQAAIAHMRHELERRGEQMPLAREAEPLEVCMSFVFRCPASDHRKTKPVERRPHMKANADLDNCIKAVLDAGNGVLWSDDAQVVRVSARKAIARQGEEPGVYVAIRAASRACYWPEVELEGEWSEHKAVSA